MSDNLGVLLGSIVNGRAPQLAEKDYGISIDPEAQLATLKEVYDDYRDVIDNGVPFAVGDWVTPKARFSIKGVGMPHIVLEVLNAAQPYFYGEPSSARNGCRQNMRVACFVNNEAVAAFWCEAHEYEEWTLG